MNVENAPRELRHERAAQKSHIARKTNQINAAGLQDLGHFRVVLQAVNSRRTQELRGNAKLPGECQARSFRLVRKHYRDFSVQPIGKNVLGNRFKVGAATREQDPEARLTSAA